MPEVFRYKAYRFFFFSNEGDPREPVHIHIRAGGARAKFWIRPVALADNFGFAAHEVAELAKVVAEHETEIERAWHEHFGN